MPEKPKIEKDHTLEALDTLLEGGYAPRRRRLKRKRLEEETPDLQPEGGIAAPLEEEKVLPPAPITGSF